MTTFRDTEKHLSQIPAMHLLQALGYRMLIKTDVDTGEAGQDRCQGGQGHTGEEGEGRASGWAIGS